MSQRFCSREHFSHHQTISCLARCVLQHAGPSLSLRSCVAASTCTLAWVFAPLCEHPPLCSIRPHAVLLWLVGGPGWCASTAGAAAASSAPMSCLVHPSRSSVADRPQRHLHLRRASSDEAAQPRPARPAPPGAPCGCQACPVMLLYALGPCPMWQKLELFGSCQ